ncbi:MAG: shikimate kinase [Saprospiraceae bacterium]
MRIFLLGFMGSGKSYSGKRLAEKFGMSFIDLDDYIETKEERTIREIFEKEGEDYFREIEKTCLHELGGKKMTIISTGGGTPCFFDNMSWMNKNGVTVFLETSVDILSNRLFDEMQKRPLLKGFSEKELKYFIEKKLEERNPFYHQTQILYLQNEEGQDVAEELRRYFFRMI